jgi:hypothetical protein
MKEMTKKLFYPLFALLVAFSLVSLASAQGKEFTGSIVDKSCSGNVIKGGDSAAAGHSGSKGCANKKPCRESGLGLFTDGKYYSFDAKGNELAAAALGKASKETGAKFKVVGELKGDTLTVTEITEAH